MAVRICEPLFLLYLRIDNNKSEIHMQKPIIYQMLPRLWGNDKVRPKKNGGLSDNGTGKFSDIDSASLEYLKWLGCSHVWYTGVIRHSTQASEDGCTASHPQFVKGKAGSPYAICDYYDVNVYLADNAQDRMGEFEQLIKRTHEAGLKVIIDFVPNHVARDYGKIQLFPLKGEDLGVLFEACYSVCGVGFLGGSVVKNPPAMQESQEK